MRMFLALALASIVSIFAIGGAEAQNVRIYKYCLEQSRGMGGWGSTLCRFDTIAQCNASKNSPWDRCVENVYKQRP